MIAASHNFVDIVKILLTYEAGLRSPHGTTALMMATRKNHVESVKLLLPAEHGMQDNAGNTAMHVACQLNCFECAQVLLGFEYGFVNNKGETPSKIATQFQNFKICELFLQNEQVLKYEKHLSSLKAQDEQIFAKYVKNHRPDAIRVQQPRGATFKYRVDLAQRSHKSDLFRTANLSLKCRILEAREEEFKQRSRSVA